jgi:hypothetical protein
MDLVDEESVDALGCSKETDLEDGADIVCDWL